MYESAIHLEVTGGWILHLAGRPWHDLPQPWPWHRCHPVTIARLGLVVPNLYQRCPCGAWRVHYFGSPAWTAWRDRNCRRHGNAHSLTTF